MKIYKNLMWLNGFPGGSEVKVSACNAGDLGSVPGSGRPRGEGNGNLLQYSCLENAMDGEAWRAAVPEAAESQTRVSDYTATNVLYLEVSCFKKNDFLGTNWYDC